MLLEFIASHNSDEADVLSGDLDTFRLRLVNLDLENEIGLFFTILFLFILFIITLALLFQGNFFKLAAFRKQVNLDHGFLLARGKSNSVMQGQEMLVLVRL